MGPKAKKLTKADKVLNDPLENEKGLSVQQRVVVAGLYCRFKELQEQNRHAREKYAATLYRLKT